MYFYYFLLSVAHNIAAHSENIARTPRRKLPAEQRQIVDGPVM